jgi:hypothetical protein
MLIKNLKKTKRENPVKESPSKKENSKKIENTNQDNMKRKKK